jgi:hypothetical protein
MIEAFLMLHRFELQGLNDSFELCLRDWIERPSAGGTCPAVLGGSLRPGARNAAAAAQVLSRGLGSCLFRDLSADRFLGQATPVFGGRPGSAQGIEIFMWFQILAEPSAFSNKVPKEIVLPVAVSLDAAMTVENCVQHRPVIASVYHTGKSADATVFRGISPRLAQYTAAKVRIPETPIESSLVQACDRHDILQFHLTSFEPAM